MTVAFRSPAAHRTTPDPRQARAQAPSHDATPVHDARRLTGPDRTGHIVLDDKIYVLRITRAGKLILTK